MTLVSSICLRHKERENYGWARLIGLLLGDHSVCHCACADLLAHSIFVLSCVETSLCGKVDLDVESTLTIKSSVLCLSLKTGRINNVIQIIFLACVTTTKAYLSIICRIWQSIFTDLHRPCRCSIISVVLCAFDALSNLCIISNWYSVLSDLHAARGKYLEKR